MGALAPALPGSRAIAAPGIEQSQSRWVLNSAGMPRVDVKVYNSGSALTVGGVYALTISGASATTKNPQVTTPSAQGGRDQTFVVAREAIAQNTWGWATAWGYCEALVEGTVDVAADDALVAVSGQLYLVKGGGAGRPVIAEALEAQSANSAALADIFFRGEAVALDGGTVQYTEVSIAAAAILDLADTPVELVPAPGAGKVLEFLGAVLFLDHAGTGFVENADNLVINYENEAGAAASEVIECTGFIDQTADTMTIAVPNGGAATAIVAKAACENKALVLVNPNDDFTDGGTTTSALRVKTSYRVHVTGW